MHATILLKALLAFIIGGSWVALSTTLADRLGGKAGGLVSGIPAPAAIAFLFIALTQSTQAVVNATTIFPIAYSFAGLLLWAYALLSRRGAGIAVTIAIILWFGLSAVLLIVHPSTYLASLLVYAVVVTVSYLLIRGVVRRLRPHAKHVSFTIREAFIRAFFGGSMIALAVVASYVGGPKYGAVFAAFPAVFVSTLVLVHRSQGPTFSAAMTMPMFLSGMVTVIGYVTVIRYLYPIYGLALGTLAGLVIIVALVDVVRNVLLDSLGSTT